MAVKTKQYELPECCWKVALSNTMTAFWGMQHKSQHARQEMEQNLCLIYFPRWNQRKILNNFYWISENYIANNQTCSFKHDLFILKDWTGMI